MAKHRISFMCSLCAAIFVLMLGALRIEVNAAFDAPYYNITSSGGEFDGEHYILNGSVVVNAFFCDGTYTYYLQADGTPMKERLTYHPDGEHVIYFDAEGHEVFNDFTHVTTSIEGNPVDDYCYFDVYGYMYVNVLTYDRSGTSLYYINPYGVMERNGAFVIDTDAANYDVIACGNNYGYANEDGTLRGFYLSYEDAINNVIYDKEKGEWKKVCEQWVKAESGKDAYRYEYTYGTNGRVTEFRSYSNMYGTDEEHLSYATRYFYDESGILSYDIKDTYGMSNDSEWCITTITTTTYDSQNRVTSELREQLDYYNSMGFGKNYICGTDKTDYSYQNTYTDNGYIETVTRDTYYYNGNFENLVSCHTVKTVSTYEDNRLMKTEMFSNYGDGGMSAYYYEYEDTYSVYNPESNTTDYTDKVTSYYKPETSDIKEFISSEITIRSMTDENNGTKTISTYDIDGNLTYIKKYSITDGEELLLEAQGLSNGTGSAYMYVQMEDGVTVEKEYRRVYSAQMSTITATQPSPVFPSNPKPGDTLSCNISNTYNAKWIQLDIDYESRGKKWKYTILPDEEWVHSLCYIVTYEYMAVE